MKLYPDYVCEHWIYDSENQPIGLILCSERNQSVMLPISEAFVGLGAKNLFTPCDGKGEGRPWRIESDPSEWDSMSVSEGRLLA